jgi:lipopolysaccharide/colanic/teichoic acid biosynthesis glycosyltransferase
MSEPAAGRRCPSRWLRARWALDRAVAVLLALPCAPLVAALAMLVRRETPGPAFVRLTRVGRSHRPFGMLKLRSMRATQPDGTAGGRAITSSHDDRITPLGRRLRRYRLDELPQLLNVVRGEMALVGPRPETPSYVDPDDPKWAEVLSARPGIIGPTQLLVHEWEDQFLPDGWGDGDVYGTTALPVKLECDAWYVHAASLRTDLAVVAGMLRRFVFGRPVSASMLGLPPELSESLARLSRSGSTPQGRPASVQ